MGLAGLAVAIGTLASPFAYSAGAMSLEEVKEPQISVKLLQQSAAAVDVDTELDCSTHTLTAKVTNKTNTAITPCAQTHKSRRHEILHAGARLRRVHR